jgi:hypothetical protein
MQSAAAPYRPSHYAGPKLTGAQLKAQAVSEERAARAERLEQAERERAEKVRSAREDRQSKKSKAALLDEQTSFDWHEEQRWRQLQEQEARGVEQAHRDRAETRHWENRRHNARAKQSTLPFFLQTSLNETLPHQASV